MVYSNIIINIILAAIKLLLQMGYGLSFERFDSEAVARLLRVFSLKTQVWQLRCGNAIVSSTHLEKIIKPKLGFIVLHITEDKVFCSTACFNVLKLLSVLILKE